MTSDAEVKVTLVKARGLIENPYHWTKGMAKSSRGDGQFAYCSIGALEEAVGPTWNPGGLARAAAFELAKAWYSNVTESNATSQVVAFNDYHGTTHTAVLSGFDKAIAAVAERISHA